MGRRSGAPRWVLDVMRRYRLKDRQLPGKGKRGDVLRGFGGGLGKAEAAKRSGDSQRRLLSRQLVGARNFRG